MTKYPAILEWSAAKNLGYAFDLNNLKGGSGFYEVDTPTNGVSTGVYIVQVMKSGVDGIVVQKSWKKSDGSEAVRVWSGSAWSSWGAVAASVGGTVGTAATGSTAAESGGDAMHKTVLTVATTLPAIAGGANLAVGKLLYTFPTGDIVVHAANMSLAITQSQGNITADTPDGGLGTTIGAGVVAVLGGSAAFENILTGQTFNDCAGTAEVAAQIGNTTAAPVAGAAFLIAASGGLNHTVYFNVADGWAASGDAAAGLAGTVDLLWSKL